jgi:hypothetical protein
MLIQFEYITRQTKADAFAYEMRHGTEFAWQEAPDFGVFGYPGDNRRVDPHGEGLSGLSVEAHRHDQVRHLPGQAFPLLLDCALNAASY